MLAHKPSAGSEAKDVTTLEWSPDSTLLATGSSDGNGRIWAQSGELRHTLEGHSGGIFSLKWNPLGTLVVTSSVDMSALVWDAATGQKKQAFTFHSAPCLDVDWRSSDSFASCSQDMSIYVCQVGAKEPVKVFQGGKDPAGESYPGHQDEVNAIRWDAGGMLLASCSDDCTAKIWGIEQAEPVHTLQQGDKIYSLDWSPPPDDSDGLPLMLATASFDNTTKVWDALHGQCLFTLVGHTSPVTSVDFRPDSLYLASGSFDNVLLIWSMKTGKLVDTYHGGGGIFEVCWNGKGDKVAACYSDNSICVVDFNP